MTRILDHFQVSAESDDNNKFEIFFIGVLMKELFLTLLITFICNKFNELKRKRQRKKNAKIINKNNDLNIYYH